MKKGTRRINLTQGKFAIVDAIDYEWLMQWKWCANRTGRTILERRVWYAMRGSGPRKNRKILLMHREIAKRARMKFSPRYDHADRNGLNNTRINIRPCTPSQNQANRPKTIGTSSKYKGVCFAKRDSRWHAQIMVERKSFYLGSFDNEKEASLAYQVAAKKHFGQYANF